MKTKQTLAVSLLALAMLASLLAPASQAGRSQIHPKQAEIKWAYDIDKGFAKAKKENKPVMVDFMAVWCPPCHAMEDTTFASADVIEKASAFVPVRIDIDKKRDVAAKYGALARKYGGIGIPNVLFMAPDGRKLKHIVGYYAPRQFIAAMDSALATLKEGVTF
ncbi:MAG: thioredoxin family protein [Candidatus Krumholzibacteria bacterium]|nr:thioredoxin family protein [Candidatus Krumholzibacteria bacterium]